MESTNITLLLQKVKEEEDRDLMIAAKIKECEAVIKMEEENIKKMNEKRAWLTSEIERKTSYNSSITIKNEMLQIQKQIWADIMIRVSKELKDAENEFDSLQQDIFNNRLSLCDSVTNHVAKSNLLEIPDNQDLNPYNTTRQIKVEHQDDKYNRLLEQYKILENESIGLGKELARIEAAKKLKIQLQSEPSNGERFIFLRNTLKQIKKKTKEVESQIIAVKKELSHKESILLNMSKIDSD